MNSTYVQEILYQLAYTCGWMEARGQHRYTQASANLNFSIEYFIFSARSHSHSSTIP